MPYDSIDSALSGNLLVSVIVPTYQRYDALVRALDSLKSQTYPHIEVVLVDDNAEPAWNARIEREAAERSDQKIVYIRNQRHLGPALSRNMGIQAASGAYISFLDDDDCYLPDKIRAQLSDMLQKNADYSLTDLYLYNDHDKLVDRRIRSYLRQKDWSDRDALMKAHMVYHMTGTDTLMFRSAYLHEIGLFPDRIIGEEFCLMLAAIEHGGVLTYLPGCYVKAYAHEQARHGISTDFVQKRIGENGLYRLKKRYFAQLGKSTVRAIRARHYAVLAFAELKLKRPSRFFAYGTTSFLACPFTAAKLLFSHLRQ